MSLSKSESYAKAGVDITAGYEGVKLMKPFVARTMIPGVCSDVGGFGGLFAPDITGHPSGLRQRSQLVHQHDRTV